MDFDTYLQQGGAMPAPAGSFDDFLSGRMPPPGSAASGVEMLASGKAPSEAPTGGDPSDWGYGHQMLDSLLLGMGPQALAFTQTYGKDNDKGALEAFQPPSFGQRFEGAPAGTKLDKPLARQYDELVAKYEAGRKAWQAEKPGTTMLSDLTVGSVPAIAAMIGTEGALAPLAASRGPAAALARFFGGQSTGLARLPSLAAKGTVMGAEAGALSTPERFGGTPTTPAIGAVEGAAITPAVYGLGAAASMLGRTPSWLKGGGLAGVGAAVGLSHATEHLLPHLMEFIHDPTQLMAALTAIGATVAPGATSKALIPAATKLKIGQTYAPQVFETSKETSTGGQGR